MEEFEINTPSRQIAFLAQVGHECGDLRWMEVWGLTLQQRKLAARLGNTNPGDGRRFRGRGAIQLMGRANSKRYGDLLGIDLVSHPERAASPDSATSADSPAFIEITRRISGGHSGLPDRQRRGWVAETLAPRGVGLRPSQAIDATLPSATAVEASPAEALERGQEAIREEAMKARDAAATPQAGQSPTVRPTRGEKSRRGFEGGGGLRRRTLDARADTLDFRDLMFALTLIEVPRWVSLGDYLKYM